MSKKKVSAIVSGPGLLAAIWTAPVAAVKKLGGTDEHIHRLSAPEGAETVDKIAALIVGKSEAQAPSPSWWSAIFTALVRACGFTYRNNNITIENFPCGKTEPGQVEVISIKKRLAELGKTWLRTEEVLAHLSEPGYRPATLLELLFWWLDNPAKHANCLVVALGQFWQGCAPCVYGDGVSRYLDLVSAQFGWSEFCEFAVVRK